MRLSCGIALRAGAALSDHRRAGIGERRSGENEDYAIPMYTTNYQAIHTFSVCSTLHQPLGLPLDALLKVRLVHLDHLQPRTLFIEPHASDIAIPHRPSQQSGRQRLPDLLVDETVESASTPAWLIALTREPVARVVLDDKLDAAVGGVEGLLNLVDAKGDDLGYGSGGEGVKDDLLVEAVELRTECGSALAIDEGGEGT